MSIRWSAFSDPLGVLRVKLAFLRANVGGMFCDRLRHTNSGYFWNRYADMDESGPEKIKF